MPAARPLVLRAVLAACLLGTLPLAQVHAQEATIRKNLSDRVPQFKQIDEVSRTAMPGLFEVRIGNDIFYTDANGDYLLQGELLDTRQRRNLTEDRVNKLSAIDFASLPTKDAFTMVRGNGKRQVAVFEDPNCGYCKRFEKDLQGVDNVTVHLYLYPILGADSVEKSRNLWCAKDKARAWQDWMVENKPVVPAKCDSAAIDRNVALGRKHKITGTPTLIFADGSRVPGAIGTQEIEKRLAAAR